MYTYPQYLKTVLQELQEKMTEEQYAESVENRMSVIEVIIMDEHDRPGRDRPTPEDCAEILLIEFGINQ